MNTTPHAPAAARPQNDHFLLAILGGIVLLLLGATLTLLVLRQPSTLLPGDSPAGTVQRFFAALQSSDYGAAYELLSDDMTDKPSRDDFVTFQREQGSYRVPQRVIIDDERINGDAATVTLEVTEYYLTAWPFGSGGEQTYSDSFDLARSADVWKISWLSYRYRSSPLK